MEEKKGMLLLSETSQLASLMKTNQYTNRFGLELTEKDTKLLVKERSEVLMEQQRIEFGTGILEKLIFAFCDSDYIQQDNYVETISRLQEIFYCYKNESMDELTDDELIEYMRQAFEGECQGSLEYLEETSLECIARKIRSNPNNYFREVSG